MHWNEQPADFRYFPLADIFAKLPFTSALALSWVAEAGITVLTAVAVKRGVYAHLSQQNIEMGGLLLGSVFRDTGTASIVSVDSFVPSEEFDGTGVSLRMGAAVWDKARAVQSEGRSVIGWYHSHPNLGVFFSGTDRRTQAAFFTQDHSLGLVVDPVRKQEMWFSGPSSVEVDQRQVLIL